MTQITKNILIVEDEKPLAQAIEAQLNNNGFQTKVASDGNEALLAISAEKFDLILLDLLLPKINGLDVLTNLKNSRNPTPVIVSSNLSDETDIQKAKDLGAVDYFIKSDVSLEDIVATVLKYLQK